MLPSTLRRLLPLAAILTVGLLSACAVYGTDSAYTYPYGYSGYSYNNYPAYSGYSYNYPASTVVVP